MGNKVKFGLKNVHYAPVTVTDGTITYSTPVKLPGAVNLVANPAGDKTTFYADDIAYFVANANNGYEGTLEVALVPDNFKIEILGYKADENGVLFEDANAIAKDFALLFEFAGDKNSVKHAFYNVNAARSNVESGTKGQNIEVKTETFAITASPSPNTGFVKAKAEPTNTVVYEAWYTTVYEYIEPTGV